jgi:hypothetical protein
MAVGSGLAPRRRMDHGYRKEASAAESDAETQRPTGRLAAVWTLLRKLDEISARTATNVETMVEASMIASLIACLIAHKEHLTRGAVDQRVVRRKRGAVHPMLVWKFIAQRATSLPAHIIAGCAGAAWERYTSNIIAMSEDRNWRNKPAPTDDAKGRISQGRAWWRSRLNPKAAPHKSAARRAGAWSHGSKVRTGSRDRRWEIGDLREVVVGAPSIGGTSGPLTATGLWPGPLCSPPRATLG